MDYEVCIKANNAKIFVDKFDEDIWLSLNVVGANIHCTLTKDAAKKMVESLNKIIESDICLFTATTSAI